jgi:hypothetical protein
LIFYGKYNIIIILFNDANNVRNFNQVNMEKIKINFNNRDIDRMKRNIEIVLLKEGLPFMVEEVNGEYFLVRSEPKKMLSKDISSKYKINYNRVWMIHNQYKDFVYELIEQFNQIKNSIP